MSELLCYPVKGCAGHSLQSAQMTARGIEHDRSFMIVDAGGSFRSQRSDPVLALITPTVDADCVTLEHASFGSVTVAVDRDSDPREVSMFRKPLTGVDQGDAVAEWLSACIGEPSRLIAVPREFDRVTDGSVPGTAGFADSSAVHILSDTTLNELNSRLDTRLPMNRFRPNIVVTGWGEPHREDLLREVTIGDTTLAYTKLAIRCPVTTVDQARGERDGAEPLKTLKTYRTARQKGVAFGSKFTVEQEGALSVGDELVVSSWGESEL